MKNQIFVPLIAIVMLGCTARDRNGISRSFSGNRVYHIKLYSGGKLIRDDKFTGVVDNQDSSDGMYYYKNDTLVEIGGQYEITSTAK